MPTRVQLVIDPVTHETVEIELPLAFGTTPAVMREELGLPSFVDLSDPLVGKSVGLAYAADRAEPPVDLAFLGGVAIRLVSRSSNDPALGLRRPLHDVDLACLHRDLKRVRSFLTRPAPREGSALRIFETAGDRIFNSLGEGRRFRFHDLRAQAGTEVDLGTVDLLADEFRFCHRLDLRRDVAAARTNGRTLSPTVLLLTKLQSIRRIPASDAGTVPERVLAPFGRHEVLIGPEAKDVRDLLALLADLPFEGPPPALSVRVFEEFLGGDWGLWKTVGLNLEMLRRSPILARLPPAVRGDVASKIERLASSQARLAPRRRFGFLSSQWWQDVDAMPTVDQSGQVS